MRGGIGVRSTQVAILALCVTAAVLIFLIALDTTPIADDYGDLPSIMHSGILQYLHNYWLGDTDRYSDAVFMVVLVKLFGAAAIHVATPLLIALLACFCVAAARAVSPPAQRGFDAVVIGCLAAITIAVSTPSIFDTLGWFNAVAIYLTGVVSAVGTTAWMARLAVRGAAVAPPYVVASFLIGFLAAGFTELVGIVIALGSLLAVANLRDVLPSGSRRRCLELAYVAVAAGSAIGVVVILLGPGSRERAHLQHGGFDLPLIASAVRANLGWANTNVGWRTLASIASGLALLQLKGVPKNQSSVRWLLVWALFACCVPILVVGVATGYSGTTTAALRTASVATAAIAVGEAVITYVLTAALWQARRDLAVLILPGAAIAATIGVAGFWTAATPVVKAEILRRTAVTARARVIHRQLHEHRKAVSVTPAPLIDFYSGAYDLFFELKPQLGYVLSGIRQYYEIPQNVAIQVVPRQQRNYCLPDLSVPAYGLRSCAQLRSERGRPDD